MGSLSLFFTLAYSSLALPRPEELKRQGATLESVQAELSMVQAQLSVAQGEMETIKAVAMVSESTKQEAIDQVKGQWQEEVASLQAIMKGTAPSPPRYPGCHTCHYCRQGLWVGWKIT